MDISESFFKELKPGQFCEELFDGIPFVCFFVKNQEGVFVSANHAFATMLGAENVSDVIGKTDHDFAYKYLADAYVEDDRDVMSQGKSLINKLELVPDRNQVLDWKLTSKTPLYSSVGTVVGIAGITRIVRVGETIPGVPGVINRAIEYIARNHSSSVSSNDLAKASGVSVSSLDRKFKAFFNTTPQKYIRRVRLNTACYLIQSEEMSFSEIAHESGFYDQSCMTREFKSELNMTPTKYRSKY
tara:strand:- start:903 stop:1631 length:729 start_codon:yes stop_codon:yes gene_type:complete